MADTIVVESPEFAESVKEGDISFLKKVGDSVQEDEIIANVATDKTTIEIKAPKAGVIEALLVEDGATIGGRSPVLKIKVGAAGASAPAPAAPAAAAAAPKPAAPKPAEPAKAAPASPQTPPPLPKAPASFTPVSSVPVTPLKSGPSITGETSGVDINKIGGTRAETRVSCRSELATPRLRGAHYDRPFRLRCPGCVKRSQAVLKSPRTRVPCSLPSTRSTWSKEKK